LFSIIRFEYILSHHAYQYLIHFSFQEQYKLLVLKPKAIVLTCIGIYRCCIS